MLNELKNMKSLQNRTCLSQRILESHQQKEATEEVETVEYQAAKQNILIGADPELSHAKKTNINQPDRAASGVLLIPCRQCQTTHP
jgi:hypothetical protein